MIILGVALLRGSSVPVSAFTTASRAL